MDPEKTTESSRYASMLYQAVLSLRAGQLSPIRQVHRMAKALALVEVMGARAATADPLSPTR